MRCSVCSWLAFSLLLSFVILVAGDLIVYGDSDTAPPEAPSNLSPPDGTITNDVTPTLSWSEPNDPGGSGIKSYRIYIDDEPTFSPPRVRERTIYSSHYSPNLNEGTFYWRVYAKDNAGNRGPWSNVQTIIIDTTPPTVDISTPSDGAVMKGLTTINVNITEDHPDTASVKIDGNKVATGLPYAWDTTSFSDGSHSITVEATDKAGNIGSDSITITVDNRPAAEFGASPTSGDEPLTVGFADHSSSVHGIASWSWDFGDGSTSGVQNPTHVYRQQGSYTVRLTITEGDDDGDTAVKTKMDYITVRDATPTASLTGDTNTDEGILGHYDAGGSSGYDAPLTYEWDWNYDGTTFNPSGDTGATQNHAWVDNGTYTVAVRVTDSDGSTDLATLDITVDNVAPTVNAGADQTVNEGDTVSLAPATFTDTGMRDTHTATVDWGDGTVEAGTLNETNGSGTVAGSHVYIHSFVGPFHVYTVTVTVTDDDSGVGADTFTVKVKDISAPSVTLTATPANPDNNPAPYFEWTGTDDHSLPANLVYSYRVDGGTWTTWAAPGMNYVTLTGLTEGTHTFEVRAKDEAGNIGAPTSYTWVLDLTSPEIRLNVPEDNAEYGLHAMVNSDWAAVDPLSGMDTATAADKGNTNMASGEPFYTGSVGLHNFTVTATDLAGNTTTVTVTYRVVYSVLPGGTAGGGGATGQSSSFLDKSISGGGGMIGTAPLEAIYTVGEPINVGFKLTDVNGDDISDAVVSCTLVKVTLKEAEESYDVLNLLKVTYNDEAKIYRLGIETDKLAPGIYDLWFGFDDETQKRLRVQLETGGKG